MGRFGTRLLGNRRGKEERYESLLPRAVSPNSMICAEEVRGIHVIEGVFFFNQTLKTKGGCIEVGASSFIV